MEMKKLSFLNHKAPLLTVMVRAETLARIRELMQKALPEGAEAFGMQFCRMKQEHRSLQTYRELFCEAGDKPVYVTNYRKYENQGKDDETLAREMVQLAECGATLCDVIGDLYDMQEDELAKSPTAVKKQMELIDTLHNLGAEDLMSSHVLKFTPAERVLEVALEQKRRGADIIKIVVGADNMEQQIENLRITNLLKNELGAPFLFLSGGECSIHRKLGMELGCCMALCVYEHDALSTPTQPLLQTVKTVCDIMSI